MRPHARFGPLLAATVALVACNGGGDSTPPPLPPASAITVGGTAASGAALAAASVSVKCASGTASATTASNGAYSVTVAGGILPCAIELTGGGGEVYHAVVAGTGSSGSFTANVTPLTEMVVAHLAGASPAAYFAAFGGGSAVGSTALGASIAYVRTALASVVDLTGIDPLTDALAVGDSQDLKIDAVMAALAASGVSMSSVTTAIVASPSAPAVVAGALAPAAAGCPWLHSARYRNLVVQDAPNERFATIDAAAGTAVDPDGQAVALTPGGPCRYTIDEADWTTTLLVSSSGVIVVHGQSKVGAERQVEFAVPEQAHPVTELAGTWNAASWEPTASGATAPFVATMAEITLDATGQVTALATCAGLNPCTPRSPPLSRFVGNTTQGGFDEILPDGSRFSRAFLFKTLSGSTAMFVVTPERQFVVATRQRAIALPAAGGVTSYRQAQLNGDLTIDDLLEDGIVVDSVDIGAKTATRTRASDGRVDTLFYDVPRNGLRHRRPNSCLNSAGGTVNCAEVVNMSMQGMGWRIASSVGSNPASAFFNLQVNKP